MLSRHFYRWLTLLSYFGLLLLLMLWFTWLAPSQTVPTSLMLLLVLGPLMFPLRGLLYGRTYTYAWSSLLILAYFIHGVVEAYANPQVRILAVLEIILTCLFYIGAILYPRHHNREVARQQDDVI
ncbi:MAG: DUF2069 domain-containing protein [Gammaproteobacteria bacterium]